MIAKRAHHVSLNVSDVERSRAFYGELLGLPEIERPDFGFPGAWFQAGQIELHLIVPPAGVPTGAPPAAANPLTAHLAFEVEDYDAVAERMRGAGLAPIEAGRAIGQLWVQDPDRNVIELIVPRARAGGRG